MKKTTYMTVEEMRADKKRLRAADISGSAKSARFEGSTVPELALQYLKKNGKILECGPIEGRFTQFLQEHEYTDIHTLDIVDILEFANRDTLTINEVDFNMEPMPYKGNMFDGATAWGIGEHLENPFFFAREVSRVLKPGGIFIFSVPNVFHIISRLVFLKRGLFPRWNETNNHISILPHGVFEKTFLRYFDLVETRYVKPEFRYFGLQRFARWLPKNQWFGSYVVYILKAK